MEQSLSIILMEVLLLTVAALIALLFLDWRKNMRCHAALEQLFADIKEREALRTERIMSVLIQQYKFDEQIARELSSVLFGAEKLFVTQFIEQQVRQQSVEGFYQNLCGLLDNYLQALPASAVSTTAGLSSVSENADPEENRQAEAAGKTPPMDWGDVFD